MRIGSRLIRTVGDTARGTAKLASSVGSHALWWVKYRLDGTARRVPPDNPRKRDH
jgi:hypothetical protein